MAEGDGGIAPLGSRVIGRCEPPNMDTENLTQVLCKKEQALSSIKGESKN